MKEGLKSEIVRVHTPCNFNVKQCKDRSKCHKYKYSSTPLTQGFSLGSRIPKVVDKNLRALIALTEGEILYFSLTCNSTLGFLSIINSNNIS